MQIDFPVSRIPAAHNMTVPLRSPLIYPGGKTWLIPHIRHWLRHSNERILIEPFGGGGTATLTAIAEYWVDDAVMIELDRDVAAFWHHAFRSGAAMAEKVRTLDMTPEKLDALLDKPLMSLEDHAFQTLLLSRTRRDGVLLPGHSFKSRKGDDNGVLMSWYPETLATRLTNIQDYGECVAFVEGDGLKLLPSLLDGFGDTAAVFIDPPYTGAGGKNAGSRLYKHADMDHKKLFSILSKSRVNFLMTYDTAPEIVELIREHEFCAVVTWVRNTRNNRMPELIITPRPLFHP